MRRGLLILFFYWLAIQIESSSLSPKFLTKKACNVEDGCKCVYRHTGTECCCKGLGVEHFPTNITASVKSLIVYNTSITRIEDNFFQSYLNIEEIILRDNGLQRMPKLQMRKEHKIEMDVDLSNNEIEYIGDGTVSGVRARIFRLNNNALREIAGYAFRGSSFFRLYLNDNKDLYSLSVDSFRDIQELHHLNLSDTSITELPITGLKNLKSLSLSNVWSLKKLPSVLSFTHLQTAHFTYPHHCCLFKYVDDVVHDEKGMYKNNMKEIHNRMCTQREETSIRKVKRQVATTPSSTTPEFIAWFDPAWFFSEDAEVTDEDEDLPEFSSDQIGVSKCLSVAIDTSVKKFFSNITCTPQPDALNPCENIVGYGLLRKAIWGIWILAIIGNICVWLTLALAYERRLQVHYLYMFNLSIADLITGVYLGILAAKDVLTADEYYRHAVAWQTGWGCQTAGFLAIFGSKLSIISMFLIAFEMAYNTKMSFFGKRMSPKVGWSLIAIGWLFAIFMACLPLVGISSYSTTSICLPLRVTSGWDRAYIFSGLMFNLLSFAGMAVCYVCIICMLRDPSTPSRDEDKAIITKMALLIGTDAICWFPTLFFGLTAAAGVPLISISNAKIFLVFFFPINAFANPFLYVFFTEVIQRKVKNKTMPVLKRITSTPQIALNTLSNFYHSQPPGKGREEPCSPTRLQMTSLNSTPRGSNCSSNQRTMDSLDGLNLADYPIRERSPRVSFQDEVYSSGHRSSAESTRRSSVIPKRISAIPEVSDLSEHSSDSHHEHVLKKMDEKCSRFNLSRILARHRHESNQSSGQDSGRGSITSTATRDTERNSLVSAGTSDGEHYLEHSRSNDEKVQYFKRKFSPLPRWTERRQSAPLIRPTVTVTECSEGSSN